jgi:hypothetical protein
MRAGPDEGDQGNEADEADAEILEGEPAGPRRLPYRSGIDDRNDPTGALKTPDVILAFFGAGAAIFAAGFFAAISSDVKRGGLIGVLSACLGLGGLAFGIRQNLRYRSWLLGIVIAIGVVGLLDGLCFIAWK